MFAGILSIGLFIIGIILMYKNPDGHIPKDVASKMKRLINAEREKC